MSLVETRIEILLTEWRSLHSGIQSYDRLTFTIRGWAASTVFAMISLGYSIDEPALFLLALGPSVLFWMLDALYKSFQGRYFARLAEIERFLQRPSLLDDLSNDAVCPISIPGTSDMFPKGKSVWSAERNFTKFFLVRNVMLTYMPMILFALFNYFLENGQIFEFGQDHSG